MTGRTLHLSSLVAAAALVACALALLAAPHQAEAAFPGKNGRIAFHKDVAGGNYQIFTVLPDGTGEKRLTNTSARDYNIEPSFSADGRKIAWNRSGDIWTMDADGTDKRRLTSGPANDTDPAFSPDGRRVAFVRYDPEDGQTDIYSKSLDGGLRRVTDDKDFEGDLSFSPGGGRIAFGLSEAVPGCGGCAYPGEIATVRTDGRGRKVLTDAPGQSEALDPDWSPDGRTLVFTYFDNGSEQARIETVGADGTGQRTVFSPDGTASAFSPVFSPDGTKIAFQYSGPDIWKIDADGTGLTNVTDTPGILDLAPNWGPKPQTTG